MERAIGVVMTDQVAVAAVEGYRISGPVHHFPAGADPFQKLRALPTDEIGAVLRDAIATAAAEGPVSAAGIGLPGIIRAGVVEESPNIQQIKGFNVEQSIAAGLRSLALDIPVVALNDADAMATGLAAARGHLDRLIRVWTLGNGIGFGRYPVTEGVWEGGHTVVSLDPKETFCGCGGAGHLEGIMGHRAMRLRFLDMEPEEVFEAARKGDSRCADFVKLWHRALAAATATSVHLDGPGKFYLTGPGALHVDVDLLQMHIASMVKMSPLQQNSFEVVSGGDEIAIVGAAVRASQAARA